ncbi:MAG: putative diacylglycerol O-acyltransferase [Acidimicrobiales bacterium]|nr:MAG: wax ester/triacylglycerol synthase family O-acyltransferase [Actinomycetota bacterium]MBV6509823.1 putative diacylglycerol O-acyltransferase [Acidimicrobiales bacterium]RIK04422.1 MAG: hypothetical protein DCC48_13675 [Acidobacteriota bacterium]
MTPEALTAEDAALLSAAAPGTQLQIGALCFFEAEPLKDRRGRLRVAALRSHAEARLGALPRFRQRIAPVLADLAPPVWVDDTDFDIARHAKHHRLPPPGGTEALRQLMGRLLSEPMDLAHPLWDLHLIEGVGSEVAGGEHQTEAVAVVIRAHHVMADGLALHAAATLLLDPAPRRYRSRPHQWSPDETPGVIDLTARSLAERTRRQADLAIDLTRTFTDPRQIASLARSLGSGLPPTAPKLPFTGPVGRRRAFAWGSLPLADIVAVKEACGATVNDVVLAIVTGALRRRMEAGGRCISARAEPRALIPIGSPDSTAALGNRFSITNVLLPMAVDDPLERVRLIHSRMHEHASSPANPLTPHLFAIADFVPPPVLRAVVPRLLARQPLVNLAVSNIPGSRQPLYLWESRLLGLHPFIDVVGNVALIVGVLSYGDELGVGITVDPDVAGDPSRIATELRASASELFEVLR